MCALIRCQNYISRRQIYLFRAEQNQEPKIRHDTFPFIPLFGEELMTNTDSSARNKRKNNYNTRIPSRIELITGQGHGSHFSAKNVKGKPILKEAITKYLFEKGFSPIWPATNPGKCYIDKRQIYAFLDEKDFQQRRNELFKICLYRTVPIWAVLVFPVIFPLIGEQ